MNITFKLSVLVSTDKVGKLNRIMKLICQFCESWSTGIETDCSTPDNSRSPYKLGQVDMACEVSQEEAYLLFFTLSHILRNMKSRYANLRFRLIDREGVILDDTLVDEQG